MSLKCEKRLSASKVVFGGSGIGGLYQVVDQDSALATLQRALEHGITHFDTAPLYGIGLSEKLFGMAFAGKAGLTVSTKVGRIIQPISTATSENVEWSALDQFWKYVPVKDYSASGVSKSWLDSVSRLNGVNIAVLRLHDAETDIEFEEAREGVEKLIEMKRSGLVNRIGLGMGDPAYIMRFLKEYPAGTWDSVMMAGCWNLMDWSGLHVLQECSKQGIEVVNVGIFGGGFLWGGPRLRYVDASDRDIDKRAQWQVLAEKHGFSLPELAVAFAYAHSSINFVAMGVLSVSQLDSCMSLVGQLVPKNVWIEAQELNLLPGYLSFD